MRFVKVQLAPPESGMAYLNADQVEGVMDIPSDDGFDVVVLAMQNGHTYKLFGNATDLLDTLGVKDQDGQLRFSKGALQ